MGGLVRPLQVSAVLLCLLAVPAAAGAPAGFAGPTFGIASHPNGDIMVADAGQGITDSVGDLQFSLPGVTSIAIIGRRAQWATTTGFDGAADTGQALWRVHRARMHNVANLFAYESAANPDGAEIDSNPYDVATLSGTHALVVDAAANDLLRVDNKGGIDLLAVFPPEVVSTDNLKALADCDGTPPPEFADFCDLPPAIPGESVPTSVVIGDGGYYVGELKGFPAPADASNIWWVDAGADAAVCGSSPDCTKVFDGGFTSIIDMAMGPDGKLYVAEFDEGSWAAVEIFGAPAGGTINACDVTTMTCDEVATDLPLMTGIAFTPRGALHAVIGSLTPSPEVIEIPLP